MSNAGSPGKPAASGPTSASVAAGSTAAVVVLDRVHARSADRGGGSLVGATGAFGAGVHAVVGRPADGTRTLVDAVAGRLAIRAGRLLVAGRSPAADPTCRAQIACLPPTPALAFDGTVAHVVEAVRRWRGGLAFDPLELPGLGSLARRRAGALTRTEARGLELGLALAVQAPALLVLYEPGVDLPPVEQGAVGAIVRERARAGTSVLVVTSSPRDAARIGADDLTVLRAGRIVGPPLPAGWGVATGSELLLWVDDTRGGGVRALAAALGRRGEIGAVAWQQGAEPALPAVVTVRAAHPSHAALAVAEEATRLGTAVLLVETSDPGLDDLARWAFDAERMARSPIVAEAPRGPAPADKDARGARPAEEGAR